MFGQSVHIANHCNKLSRHTQAQIEKTPRLQMVERQIGNLPEGLSLPSAKLDTEIPRK